MKLSIGLNTSGRMYVLRIECVSHKEKKYVELIFPLPHNKTLLRHVLTGEVIGEDEVILEKSGPIIYCD